MMNSTTSKNIVFYADDDSDDLELVRDAFDKYANNVEMVTANDGVQALSYLQSLSNNPQVPCLILLDINMPLLDGRDVLRKIREMPHLRSVPVVLFTTSSSALDREFGKRYNAGFVTKPLDISQMETITEVFISHCNEEIKKNIRRHSQ